MVTLRPGTAGVMVVSVLLLSLRPAVANVPDYKLGDVAAEDVVTPVRLLVVDPQATEVLKQKLAQDVSFVLRYAPQTAGEAEAALLRSISVARINFLTMLQGLLKWRALTAADVDSVEYKATLLSIAAESPKNLPLEKLAPLWVSGQGDQAVLESLLQPVRGVMARPIVNSKTDNPFPANQVVRLVPVKNLKEPPTSLELQNPGTKMTAGQVLSLWRARRLVETSFPTEQEAMGKFAATFVQINADADPATTDLLKAQRMEGVTANETYEPAQIIIRKGQVVDRKALGALAMMREKSMIGTLQSKLAQEQSKLAQEQSIAGEIKRQTHWIATSLGVICVALLLVLARLRARPSTALVIPGNPALSGSEQQALPGGAGEGGWRDRAMLAEGKAERAHAAIRSGVMVWMREKIFQTLFRHRAELLSAQQKAQAEMTELEQRLEQLHTPLRERICAYEKRIEELERDVASKGEENRELIGARIHVARQQLSMERERERKGVGSY